MAPNSPEPYNPVDFRAPPPSPIASGRKSSFANDDVLTDFLEHSLRVPDLILPDNIFPRQKFIESPPVIDFDALVSADSDAVSTMMHSVATIGCFQLVNHGISSLAVTSVQAAGMGIFRLPPEMRAPVTRSPEKPYGFDEVHGDQEIDSELSEEFVWSMDQGLKLRMDGIWPFGYSNFCQEMEALWLKMEKVAEKILLACLNNGIRKSSNIKNDEILVELGQEPSVCCLYKHSHSPDVLINDGLGGNSVKYDVIRMLIRRTDYSHALCFHLCEGSSEFHVYSKKGWVSFTPSHKHVFLITIGDKIQTWSGGKYKHVIGRPIFKANKEDCISMAFLYSPQPSIIIDSKNKISENTISLTQQLILAVLLTFVFHFLVYIYTKF